MTEFTTKEQVISMIANTNFKLSADDWTEITNAIKDIKSAKVVERAEYEAVCEKCNELENRIENQRHNLTILREHTKILRQENNKLRSKLDKAISRICKINPMKGDVHKNCDDIKFEVLKILYGIEGE